RADCDCRLCHAIIGGPGDVGLVAAGHGECLARRAGGSIPPRAAGRSGGRGSAAGGSGATMNVLVYLVPMALGLGLIGLAAFFWSLKHSQYEDLEGASLRMLSDDDVER